MFCDHRNLIHVFAPDENVKRHIRGKLLRWAMKLTEFRYTVNHIAGTSNVWADMLSRWACQSAVSVQVRRVVTRGAQQQQLATLHPLDDEHFVWPSLAEVQRVQKRHVERPLPSWLSEREDGLQLRYGMLWIPTEAIDLLNRLLIISHCGQQGHRGRHAMLTQLARVFSIEHLRTHADGVLKRCLLCQHVKGGKIIPRTWSETFRSET